jgi:hypothetical protein
MLSLRGEGLGRDGTERAAERALDCLAELAVVLKVGLSNCNTLDCRGFQNRFHFYKLRAGVAVCFMERAVAVDTFS